MRTAFVSPTMVYMLLAIIPYAGGKRRINVEGRRVRLRMHPSSWLLDKCNIAECIPELGGGVADRVGRDSSSESIVTTLVRVSCGVPYSGHWVL